MSTKWSIFKTMAAAALLVAALPAQAGGRSRLRLTTDPDSVINERYHHRIHHLQSAWEKMIPSMVKLQYAGGMGMVSGGIGWDYGRSRQWETDFMMGFLPKFESDKAKLVLTLKENYIPWEVGLGRSDVSLDPLTVSVYVTSIIADDFWTSQPERYPEGYYWFSTRFRLNLSLGQRLVFDIPENRRKLARNLTVFYEVGTNDFYLLSLWGNEYIKFKDILHLSLGLKFQIF